MDSERRSQRYPSHNPLQLRCRTWGEFVETYASDVCRGGMFIRTDDAPEVLSSIELRLILPEGTEVSLGARVVHVVTTEQADATGRPAGIGVEFVHTDAEQKRQILQLVEFARNHANDPNTSFARTLLETSASIPARDVVARLSNTPDSAADSGTQRASKASRLNMPAVQIESEDAEPSNTNHAVRPPPRPLSAPLDPSAMRAGKPIVRTPTGPLAGSTARSSANMPGVRAPSGTIARPATGPVTPPGRSSTNIPIVRTATGPLTSGTAKSSANVPIVRTPTGPVTPTSAQPDRAPSVPIDTAAGSGPEATQSAQPAAPAKPTDLNRLKLVINALNHKHFEDAIRLSREMLTDNPGDLQVLKWQTVGLARMALARNDAPAAAEQYEKVLRYEDGNREAREFVRAFQRDKKLSSLPFGRYFMKKK